MDLDFSVFCSCSHAARALLKRRIDACAAARRSYEFPRCHMPRGCTPEACTLGFWREGTGYLLYFRPAPVYKGEDCRFRRLFSQDSWFFASFDALSDALERLEPSHDPTTDLFFRLRAAFRSFICGQEQAVESVSFKIYSHICKQSPHRPLSLVLYGPTGVGKSELAKGIAPVLNQCCPNRNYQLVWTELNTFTHSHSAYRLIGAPPGYVGYDDTPILESVRRNPYTVFLFDELEKAHPEILKIFMSILDEGRYTARQEDADGSRELDFRRCIFVFTSNAPLSAGRRRLGFSPPPELSPPDTTPLFSATAPASGLPDLAHRVFAADEQARQAMVRSGVLKEIAGRFSGFIRFQELDEEAKAAVTARQIMALGREHGLQITQVDPATARFLTPDGALSQRSTMSVLESMLTPLFHAYASRFECSVPLRLTGLSSTMQLLPSP